MSEKPKIDIRRFEPEKIPAKYWIKFVLYALILMGLYFWYRYKTEKNELAKIEMKQTELNLKGVKIEEN